MNCSDNLQQFLDFVRNSVQDYKIAIDREAEANAETQDLLHALELETWQDEDLINISKTIAEVRNARRKAKDDSDIRQPIVEWVEQNERVIKGLEQLLGQVRKIESGTEGRFYREKTSIMNEAVRSEHARLEQVQLEQIQPEQTQPEGQQKVSTKIKKHSDPAPIPMITCPECGEQVPLGREIVRGHFKSYCKYCRKSFYTEGGTKNDV